MALHYANLGEVADLKRQLLTAAFDRACMAEPWPTTRVQFEQRRDEARARLSLIGQELARLIGIVLAEYQMLGKKLQGFKSFTEAVHDIQDQLARLLPKSFIEATPYERLQHYPRYLKAIGLRLDKLRVDPARDARAMAEFAPSQTGRDRFATRAVSLDAGGVARAVVCAGIAHTGTGIGQALAEALGIDATLVDVNALWHTETSPNRHARENGHPEYER
jgi:ATP-dependent helicase HrpA